MEEELSFDNMVLDDDFMNFIEDEPVEESSDTDDDKDKKDKTTEVDNEDPEGSENPLESVGSDSNQGEEDADSSSHSSPNFYSSIAKALVDDGIFQNLDEEKVSKLQSAEDFAEIFSEQINSKLSEKQRRIDEALSLGIEPDEIKKCEKYLSILDNIKEDAITEESEEGENLRKNIIFQDYINKGFSKERAAKEVNKSIEAGTDIEDAKEALQSNKEYYNDMYNDLIEDAKKERKIRQDNLKKEAEKFRDSIFNDKKAFGEIELDNTTKQKVYDSIMKPIFTDSEGRKLTAIQKYEAENRPEFLKNLGLVFVLTDGFKKLDGLVKGKVNKEIKKGLRELENTINNTSRTSEGKLNFASGISSESKFTGWDVDI